MNHQLLLEENGAIENGKFFSIAPKHIRHIITKEAFGGNEKTAEFARDIITWQQQQGGQCWFSIPQDEVAISKDLTDKGWVVERDGHYLVTEDFILRCYHNRSTSRALTEEEKRILTIIQL